MYIIAQKNVGEAKIVERNNLDKIAQKQAMMET